MTTTYVNFKFEGQTFRRNYKLGIDYLVLVRDRKKPKAKYHIVSWTRDHKVADANAAKHYRSGIWDVALINANTGTTVLLNGKNAHVLDTKKVIEDIQKRKVKQAAADLNQQKLDNVFLHTSVVALKKRVEAQDALLAEFVNLQKRVQALEALNTEMGLNMIEFNKFRDSIAETVDSHRRSLYRDASIIDQHDGEILALTEKVAKLKKKVKKNG